MRIETERLILRTFEMTDKDDLCEYMLQRVNAEYECYPAFTAEKAAEETAFRCKSDEFIAIERKADGKVIGNVYMGKRSFNARELGFVLNETCQKQGYGSEAARAAAACFFAQGVHRIYAECCPGNTASWKTMEKIGMRREAHFIQNISFHTDSSGNPRYQDTYVYALLQPEAPIPVQSSRS